MYPLQFEYFTGVLEDDSFDKLIEEHGKVISDDPKRSELPTDFIDEYLISHEYLALVDSSHRNIVLTAPYDREHPKDRMLILYSSSKNFEEFDKKAPMRKPPMFKFVKFDFDMLAALVRVAESEFQYIVIDSGVHGVLVDAKEVYKSEARRKGLPVEDAWDHEDEFAKMLREVDEEISKELLITDAQAGQRKEEAIHRYVVRSKYLVPLNTDTNIPFYMTSRAQNFNKALMIFTSDNEYELFVATYRFSPTPMQDNCQPFEACFDDIVYLMSEKKYGFDSLMINREHQRIGCSRELIFMLRDNKDKYLN